MSKRHHTLRENRCIQTGSVTSISRKLLTEGDTVTITTNRQDARAPKLTLRADVVAIIGANVTLYIREIVGADLAALLTRSPRTRP